MVVGLGSEADITAAKVVPTVVSTAGTIGTSVAVGTHAIAASSLAVPIIGAAVAGATLVIGMWLGNIAKHNAEKAATTKIVDEAEPYLKQNRDAYLSSSEHTQGEKDQALANFDNIWGQVVQACSNGQYEDAGKRCVEDRQRGGKWDWFSYYRDPIANTTVTVQPVSAGISNVIASTGLPPIVVYGVLALVAIELLGKAFD